MATTVSQPGYYNLQAFTSTGALMAGGRLYTYTAGTTTKKNAYTEQTGTTVHTYTADGGGGEYIALDSRGELSAPLYLASGAYDITLKTAAGATVWTRRADPTPEFLQSGTDAVTRSVQSKLSEFHSLQDFGTVGDGTTDDTTAVQAAFTWLAGASYRKLVGVPGDNYKITASITAGGTYAAFDGQSCGFKNAINATPANPLFSITTATLFSFGGFNQTVDSAATKGHGIAVIGSGLTPSYIKLHDINLNYLVGSGKDSTGASMNACGVYCYGIGKLDIDNVSVLTGTNGMYLDLIDKLTITRSVADTCTNQGIYLYDCTNVDIGVGTVINGCGTTGQGGLEFAKITSLSFHNSRIKGGAGSQILSSNTSYSCRRISIRDNHFEVYSNSDDAIKLRTHCIAPIIEGNDIQVVPDGTNNYTALINIADTPGFLGYGGRIVSNNFRLGGAVTVVDAIKLSSTTNASRGWVIESNMIGSTGATEVGGASTITNAINLAGTGSENKVRSNTIGGSSTQTITNGIVISSSQTYAEVNGNLFLGTVTNQYVDSGISTLSDRTGSFVATIYGSSSAGTVGYPTDEATDNICNYVRVGKMGYASIYLNWSSHTGTGDLRIGNLPFTFKSTTNEFAVGTVIGGSLTFTGQLCAYAGAGVNWIRIAQFASAGAVSFVQVDGTASLLINIVGEVA